MVWMKITSALEKLKIKAYLTRRWRILFLLRDSNAMSILYQCFADHVVDIKGLRQFACPANGPCGSWHKRSYNNMVSSPYPSEPEFPPRVNLSALRIQGLNAITCNGTLSKPQHPFLAL